MATSEEIVSTLLKIAVDTPTIQATLKGLDKVRGGFKDITASAKEVTFAAPKAANAIVEGTDRATKSVVRLRDAYDAAKKAAQETSKAGGDIGGRIGNIAGVGSRALGAVGLGEIGGAVNSIGDVAEVGAIAKEVQGLVKEIAPLQGIAATLTPALGAMGASFAALSVIILPIAAAVAAVALVMKLLQDNANAAAKATKDALAAEEARVNQTLDIQNQANTATREALDAQAENLQFELDLRQKQLAQAQETKRLIDEEYAALGESFNPSRRSELGASGQEAQTEIDRLSEAVNGLTTQYVNNRAAADSLTLAERELEQARTDAAEKHLAEMQYNESLLVRLRELEATGTSEQTQARIDSIQRELGVLAQYQQAATEYAQSLEQGSEANRLASERAEEYGNQIARLQTEQDALTNSVLPLIEAREKEAAAVEDLQKTQDDLIAATKQYNEDVASIEAKSREAQSALLDRYSQKLIDIADQAAEAAENALTKLIERRDALAQDFAQGELDAAKQQQLERMDAQVAFQREEAKAARDHARDLQRIQRDAKDKEFDLILNRDFAGLFNLRRQTARQIEESNISYNDQRRDRLEAFQQETADREAQYEIERQARFAKYQQDLAEAAAQYQREQAQIEANRRTALSKAQTAFNQEQQLLAQKYQTEYNTMRSAYEAELQLVAQGGQARVEYERQIQLAIIQQYKAVLASITGNVASGGGRSTPTRALGGFLGVGQLSSVNEANSSGREGFRTLGGQSYSLPGAGLFIPTQPGNVTSGGAGSPTINLTQNITGGANAELIGEIAAAKAKTVLRQVLAT